MQVIFDPAATENVNAAEEACRWPSQHLQAFLQLAVHLANVETVKIYMYLETNLSGTMVTSTGTMKAAAAA